ncbi:MAG TPA: 4-hydroxy-3-methylbut-2-enyl diphosphate reductase, partial [Gammaproteobacteria bacterium]|nr:4-hydroxy-3-methylbut-2-enyl diphosphate reductase [Gammaproteobacteria bacterium]
MEILLAKPRGFCAGVDRAIAVVQAALEKFGATVYVRHEVVHNRFVVGSLKKQGAIFVDELEQIPDHAHVIFSAHGVSQEVRKEALRRDFAEVLDATCPLVTKVHMEVARLSKHAYECVLIGHKGHAEVDGTLGQYDNEAGGIYLIEKIEDVHKLQVKNPDLLFFVTQTTLSVSDTRDIIQALKEKFPKISGPKKADICYATQNRQDAVKKLAELSDVVLVVGSQTSSNSNRLKELAKQCGTPAYLLDSADQIEKSWFENCEKIGITAGASAPEVLVEQVINALKLILPISQVTPLDGIEEKMIFSLPKGLRDNNHQRE